MNAIELIEPVPLGTSAPLPEELQPERTALPAVARSATPAELLRIAVERGDELARVEKLMALQERWEAGEARKAHNEAFAAFKAEAVRIIKSRRVTDGPLKGKSYAELYAVVDAVTPALSKHGLSASWSITKDDRDWIEVTCTLKHRGGHSESVALGGPPDTGGAKNAIQARASTVSYLERYTLKAILGLAESDDDDDGNGGKDAKNLKGGTDKSHTERGTGGESREFYPQDRFTKNLPEWQVVIQSGRKTADQMIGWLETKNPLTDAQKATLRSYDIKR